LLLIGVQDGQRIFSTKLSMQTASVGTPNSSSRVGRVTATASRNRTQTKEI